MIQSLLMFPLESELMHFCASLEAKEISFKKEKNYYSISAWNAFAAIGGHGKTQFGIQTQFYLNQSQKSFSYFVLELQEGLILILKSLMLYLAKKLKNMTKSSVLTRIQQNRLLVQKK